MYCSGIEIAGCRFTETRATASGGVLYVSGSPSAVKISDSRFEKNSALDASGNQGNCGAFLISAASVSISNTSFIKNSAGSGTGCGNINAQADCISVRYRRGIIVSSIRSLREIPANSPCVNGGSADTSGLMLPEKDLSGNVNRIVGKAIDVGAYEYPVDISIRYFSDRRAAVRRSDPAAMTVCTIDGKIICCNAAQAASGGIVSRSVGAGIYLVIGKTESGGRIIRKLVRY